MSKKRVMIELKSTPPLVQAAMMAADISTPLPEFSRSFTTPDLDGIEIDHSFPLTPLPSKKTSEFSARFAAATEAVESPSYVVRGQVDEEYADEATASLRASPQVEAVYADPVIEPCITCGSTPPLGTHADIARLLGVDRLKQRGMNGEGVLLAIVDTGINLAYLRSKGLDPNFNAARSWIPTSATPPASPGNMPVDHGTMCAFDALISAPAATLLDIAVLSSRTTGGSVMGGLLSDAVLGYSFLYRILTGPRRPGDFHSMVISNSWGMFQMTWDFPKGDPRNYSDNPNHPFNRIVATLEEAGADILFAAGNCGHECPDSRCGTERDAGIYGANSHPQVLSIAGVDINKNRVGYSTRGPGHLTHDKPDISGFTHFKGSGVYPADGGTSAATPVVAGLMAAFRTKFPSTATATPATVRQVFTRTAEERGSIGFDLEYGWGVVNGPRLAGITSLTASSLEAAQPLTPSYDSGDPSMPQDDAFMQALAAFEQDQTSTLAAPDVCGAHKKVRPILQGILPFLGLIPRIGKPAAQAIQALMAGLDSFCGISTPGAGFATFATAIPASREQSFMAALAEFEQPGACQVAAASIDVCGTYRKVRPILAGLLPFICAIPSIGKAICAALNALMAALDALCPVS